MILYFIFNLANFSFQINHIIISSLKALFLWFFDLSLKNKTFCARDNNDPGSVSHKLNKMKQLPFVQTYYNIYISFLKFHECLKTTSKYIIDKMTSFPTNFSKLLAQINKYHTILSILKDRS